MTEEKYYDTLKVKGTWNPTYGRKQNILALNNQVDLLTKRQKINTKDRGKKKDTQSNSRTFRIQTALFNKQNTPKEWDQMIRKCRENK